MYELGTIGDLANLMFSLVGVWMAHVLYKTPRRRWQTIAASSDICCHSAHCQR